MAQTAEVNPPLAGPRHYYFSVDAAINTNAAIAKPNGEMCSFFTNIQELATPAELPPIQRVTLTAWDFTCTWTGKLVMECLVVGYSCHLNPSNPIININIIGESKQNLIPPYVGIT